LGDDVWVCLVVESKQVVDSRAWAVGWVDAPQNTVRVFAVVVAPDAAQGAGALLRAGDGARYNHPRTAWGW